MATPAGTASPSLRTKKEVGGAVSSTLVNTQIDGDSVSGLRCLLVRPGSLPSNNRLALIATSSSF